MKVSLNWIKEYLNIDKNFEEISDILTSLGLEASYQKIGKNFSDVVVGKILECIPHENADNLSVCKVDIGDDNYYNIVCGAPNVKKGIYVPVAKVGSTLQNGEFKIKKAKLRGIESHGMICSGKELSINDDHEGIMILNSKEDIGIPIEDVLVIKDDVVFEIDLTPNRGDCLSHLGVARELGIAFNKNIIHRKWDNFKQSGLIDSEVKINIDELDACPRYAARVIKGVKVGPSPKWLIERLDSIGLSTINNIVDAANYVLMDSGHPMHTFDLDKISDKIINVRYAKEGEEFITLDSINRKLNKSHLLICDNKKPVAIAGVMGGMNSEIDADTKNLLLESAYFNPTIIRKGAKSLDLSTEASRRFERGTDIDEVLPSINQLTSLILELAGGTVSKNVIDIYPHKKKPVLIEFSKKNCEKLLGISISNKDIEKIFSSLYIKYSLTDNVYKCTIPTFRNDITREVDLFEEIARIVGYDNVKMRKCFSASYSSFVDDEHQLDSKLRSQLCASGFYEHYSNSLQNKELTSHFSSGEAVQLINPLSIDMEYIRNSILPGLLVATSYNEKRQQKGFKLFEIGAIHSKSNKTSTGVNEKFHLGLLWYGNAKIHWREHEQRDIFRCKGEVRNILNSIGIKNVSFRIGSSLGFQSSLKIYIGKTHVGIIGLPVSEVLKKYDINNAPFLCDLSLHLIYKFWKNNKINYSDPVTFPSMTRDIALLIDQDVLAGALLDTIYKNAGNYLIDATLFDIYESNEVGDNKKSLAFSLKYQSGSATLTDKEVDRDVELILKSLKDQHGAVQR